MKHNDFFIPPFNSARIRDKYLVSNMLGSWDFLTRTEFVLFHSFRVDRGSSLFHRLMRRGLVVDKTNVRALLKGYRDLNANLYRDAGLHIAVLTTRCNLACSYCQAGGPRHKDMSLKVAERVLANMFGVKKGGLTLEFQGGEPLLNWPVLRFMVEKAGTMAKREKKSLRMTVVTNALLLDDEKMDFLDRHGVVLCVSFDGPQKVHDANRMFLDGRGTYKDVIAKIKAYKKRCNKTAGLLPTVTQHSMKYPKELVDEYVSLGQDSIALRFVNNMGAACSHWREMGCTPEEFCSFYTKAMDHILELNRSGILIRERMATVLLTKILFKRDPGYVDLMSPCGAGRSVMAYMPDGSCYPCDEARMLGEEMFILGSVLEESYDDMMKKENLMGILQASCSELWSYSSVYSPWIGTCPMINYALQRNIVPKIHCSAAGRILKFQLEYLFEKILTGGKDLAILAGWPGGKRNG